MALPTPTQHPTQHIPAQGHSLPPANIAPPPPSSCVNDAPAQPTDATDPPVIHDMKNPKESQLAETMVGKYKTGDGPNNQSQQPSVSEQEEKKEQPPQDVHGNAMVFVMGISKYKGNDIDDLPGVRTDAQQWRELWSQKYGYDVFPTPHDTEWFGKEAWTCRDIHLFFEQGKKRLVVDGELRYDSLIVVIGGHGYEDGVIFPSDWHLTKNPGTVNIQDLHAKFDRYDVTRIPRLFIVDCCRGSNNFNLAVTRGDSKIENKGDLTFTLYGNTEGNSVFEFESGGGGGFLSQNLRKAFRHNIGKGQILLKVQNEAAKHLKKASKDTQSLVGAGDETVQTKVFVPKSRYG